jgi:hypothetical protein
VVVLLLYVRKGNVKQGLETRPSSLLNYIMKSDINEQFDIVSEGKYPVKVTRVTAEAAVMEEEKGENENSGEDELINAGPDSSKMDSTTVEAAVVEEKGENEATVMEKKGEKEASSSEDELIDAGAHSAKMNDTPEVVEETEKREASGEDDEDMKGAEECAVDTTVESDDGEESST